VSADLCATDYRHRARLLIADDHTLVAEACKRLLEPEFDVLAIVKNGRELIERARELTPEVVIIDVGMPQLNGLDAGEQLKQALPSCKLVYLTMNMAPDVAAEAFRRGASAYVVKSAAAEELTTAVRKALRSESFLSPLITKDTVDFLRCTDMHLMRKSASLLGRAKFFNCWQRACR